MLDSFVTLWTVSCQVPLPMGFPCQEYWSKLLFPSPGDLLNPGIEPASPTFAGRFWWLSGKEHICQCRRREFDPWVRKIPWWRKWQLTPVFLLRIAHGWRRLVGYSPWCCKSQILLSDWAYTHIVDLQCGVNFCCTTKWLLYIHTFFSHSFPLWFITGYWI